MIPAFDMGLPWRLVPPSLISRGSPSERVASIIAGALPIAKLRPLSAVHAERRGLHLSRCNIGAFLGAGGPRLLLGGPA